MSSYEIKKEINREIPKHPGRNTSQWLNNQCHFRLSCKVNRISNALVGFIPTNVPGIAALLFKRNLICLTAPCH
jgi:hypothetical protein